MGFDCYQILKIDPIGRPVTPRAQQLPTSSCRLGNPLASLCHRVSIRDVDRSVVLPMICYLTHDSLPPTFIVAL